MTSRTRQRLGSFFVPIVAVAVLFYNAMASLQIALSRQEVLVVVGGSLLVAAALGALAAFAGDAIRVAILVLSTVLLLDVVAHLPNVFDWLSPTERAALARDTTRVRDLRTLQQALEKYAREIGPPPAPGQYGEGGGRPSSFWQGWWDLSTDDGNHDGRPFMDFLATSGVLPSVPVDPANIPAKDGGPTGGRQYVYFVVPPGYDYEGGVCEAARGREMYMLAVTDLETEPSRPSRRFSGSGCSCLWQRRPGFFEQHFDYLLCGTVPPRGRAR